MKKMTCKQLGGACDIEFLGESFDDIASQSKKHGMEMFQKGDVAHILIQSIAYAASQKKNIITTKESIEAFIDQLFNCPEHAHTPNGKKIMQTIPLEEIANKF